MLEARRPVTLGTLPKDGRVVELDLHVTTDADLGGNTVRLCVAARPGVDTYCQHSSALGEGQQTSGFAAAGACELTTFSADLRGADMLRWGHDSLPIEGRP